MKQRAKMHKLTMTEALEQEGELRVIEGYPNCYAAPSGNVYARSATTPNKLYRLSRCLRKNLPIVNMPVSGQYKYCTEYVNHLIAVAYLPPPPYPNAQVRFIDGNQNNCAASNLEWVFNPQRVRKGYRLLRAADIAAIKARLAAGEYGNQLAREYGVSVSMISRIKNGSRHSDVSRER